MLLTMLLAACGPAAEKDSGVADADADGYGAQADGGDDCDDADPSVNPGANEVCDADNVDEDCNGLADDEDEHTGGTQAWPDADADGYGEGDGLTACDPAETSAGRGGDCDDTRGDVHPGATEVCDEADVDEDCDGTADNADSSSDVATRTTIYADADGDTYGGAEVGLKCDPGIGETLDSTDCDDSDAAVHPGATEVCDEAGVDEDCDGLANDADASLDPASGTVVYDDDDGDGYGAGPPHPACVPGRGESEVDGDCDDTDAELNPADEDGDGLSSCDGDCDDTNDRLNLADEDGDGLSSCAGDCDDADAAVESGCGYTTMAGEWGLSLPCVFVAAGVLADDLTPCPDCEFAFSTTNTRVSGDCIDDAQVFMGYDEDAGTLSFQLLYSSSYSELGPFPASVTPGAGYDLLSFDGRVSSYTYYGELRMY